MVATVRPATPAEPAPAASVNTKQLAELRRLILAPYLRDMARLHAQVVQLEQQVADQQTLLEGLGPMVAETVTKMLHESRDEMVTAIAPLVGPAIKTQVRDAREDIIDALYPVIGRTITKSMTEAMRGLVESIDHNVKKTFSFKRKLKAKVSGVSEAALTLRDALPFTVTEVFLIHTETGLLVAHVSPPALPSSPDEAGQPTENDRDLVSGMLTAIRDFVRESFSSQSGVDENSQLNQIQYGGLTILIEQSRYVYLAVVYAGIAPANYPARLRETLGWIHGGFARQLRAFGETGDGSKLARLQDLLYNLVVKNS